MVSKRVSYRFSGIEKGIVSIKRWTIPIPNDKAFPCFCGSRPMSVVCKLTVCGSRPHLSLILWRHANLFCIVPILVPLYLMVPPHIGLVSIKYSLPKSTAPFSRGSNRKWALVWHHTSPLFRRELFGHTHSENHRNENQGLKLINCMEMGWKNTLGIIKIRHFWA